MKTLKLSIVLLGSIVLFGCNMSKQTKKEVIAATPTLAITDLELQSDSKIVITEPDLPDTKELIPPPPPLDGTSNVIVSVQDVIGIDDEYGIDIVELSEQSVIIEPHKDVRFYSKIEMYEPIAEQYSQFAENKFMMAREQPLSTFSVDVDVASYSNMRRFINQGSMPPIDALRIEEMINYFDYAYTQPLGDAPVNISTEISYCPWNQKHRLVKIGLKAREIPSDKLPKSNFVFLIDTSGSMRGANRIELVKSSLKLLLNNLRAEDRVAIVTYAGSAIQLMASTSGGDKQKIREVINGLSVGGWTNGGDGMKLAYNIARKNFIKDGNNRIIMCSDGDFNVGMQSENDLQKLVEKERQSGVYLSMLGYGMGNYKDNKMQTLAQAGNGNHAYIDNLQEANKVLVNEFGATMYTVAKDVKLQIEFNPANVQAYRLVGYESRLLNKEDFNNDIIDAGEMGAGHTVTAFYEVVPLGVTSNFIGSVDPLKYQNVDKPKINIRGISPELLTVKLRYKQPDETVSKLIEKPVIDNSVKSVSGDFHFAASVAMFGQLLKGSNYKGDASYDKIVSLAQKGLENDKLGYRREFIRLVESAKGLDKDLSQVD